MSRYSDAPGSSRGWIGHRREHTAAGTGGKRRAELGLTSHSQMRLKHRTASEGRMDAVPRARGRYCAADRRRGLKVLKGRGGNGHKKGLVERMAGKNWRLRPTRSAGSSVCAVAVGTRPRQPGLKWTLVLDHARQAAGSRDPFVFSHLDTTIDTVTLPCTVTTAAQSCSIGCLSGCARAATGGVRQANVPMRQAARGMCSSMSVRESVREGNNNILNRVSVEAFGATAQLIQNCMAEVNVYVPSNVATSNASEATPSTTQTSVPWE